MDRVGTMPVENAAARGLTQVLDRIGFTRAHAGVAALVPAGTFFDALEQNSAGAGGQGLSAVAPNTATLYTSRFVAFGLCLVVPGPLNHVLGGAFAFALFAGMYVLLAAALFAPQTRGRSLEDSNRESLTMEGHA